MTRVARPRRVRNQGIWIQLGTNRLQLGVHPGRLTWNLKTTVVEHRLPKVHAIRFHVGLFPGVMQATGSNLSPSMSNPALCRRPLPSPALRWLASRVTTRVPATATCATRLGFLAFGLPGDLPGGLLHEATRPRWAPRCPVRCCTAGGSKGRKMEFPGALWELAMMFLVASLLLVAMPFVTSSVSC